MSNIGLTEFSQIHEHSSGNNKKRCKNCCGYLFLGIISLTLLLNLVADIYIGVILQMFFIDMNSVFSKLNMADVNMGHLTELYLNISHNTYVMCATNPLIKGRDELCYYG